MEYKRTIPITVTLLACLLLLPSAAGAVPNSFEPFAVTIPPGETAEVYLILSSAPSGLSGYSLGVRVQPEGSAVVTAVTFPGWAGLSDAEGIPGQDLRIRAADLGGEVRENAEDVLLATLTIPGVSMQPVSIGVSDLFYDDNNGARIIPSTIQVTVTGLSDSALAPGVTAPPTQQESPGAAGGTVPSPTPGTATGSTTPAVPDTVPGQGRSGQQFTLGLVAPGTPGPAVTGAGGVPASAETTVDVTRGESAGQRLSFASLPGIAGVLAILGLMGLWFRKKGDGP